MPEDMEKPSIIPASDALSEIGKAVSIGAEAISEVVQSGNPDRVDDLPLDPSERKQVLASTKLIQKARKSRS